MIKLQDLTPNIYYDQSRDFQLLGRLFDLVLNSAKTEADIIHSLPLSENSPDNTLDLLSLTFGLKLDRHKYTDRQIRVLCTIVADLFRNKGNLKALAILCKALLRAEQVNGGFLVEVQNNTILLSLPISPQKSEILHDVLPYILPAGFTFKIHLANIITIDSTQEFLELTDQVVYTIDSSDNFQAQLPIIVKVTEELDENKLDELLPVSAIRTGNVFKQVGSSNLKAYVGFSSTSALKHKN